MGLPKWRYAVMATKCAAGAFYVWPDLSCDIRIGATCSVVSQLWGFSISMNVLFLKTHKILLTLTLGAFVFAFAPFNLFLFEGTKGKARIGGAV